MTIIEIPNGSRGFDCNQPLTGDQARAAVAKGYSFVGRYVPRVTRHANDLTPEEVTAITGAGLGIFAVQHVESEESWEPSAAKGSAYGAVAALEAQNCGLLAGCSVAVDLEGVAVGTDPSVVLEYLSAWFGAVNGAGFLPLLYVGWHCGLSASDLYHRTLFTRFWAALNTDTDQFPLTRGICMKQHEEKSGDRPDGVAYPIDTDTAQADALGGCATIQVA